MLKWNDSRWTLRQTTEKTKDASFTYYEAKTDTLSVLAISGLKGIAVSTATPAVEVTETPYRPAKTPAPMPTVAQNVTETSAVEEPENTASIPLYVWGLLVAAVILALVLLWKGDSKKVKGGRIMKTRAKIVISIAILLLLAIAIYQVNKSFEELKKTNSELITQLRDNTSKKETAIQQLNDALAREQKEKSRENWSRDKEGNMRVSVDLEAEITGQNPGDDAVIREKDVTAKGATLSVTAERLRMNNSDSSRLFESGELSITGSNGNASIRQGPDTRVDCQGRNCTFKADGVIVRDDNGETHANLRIFSNSENGKIWANSTEAGCWIVKKGDKCGVAFGGTAD